MRWLKFNAVGAMGMAVQITTLAVGVHLLELHYILATVLAVEAALLHNFVWHVTWTWPAHTGVHRWPLGSLLRFQLITGTVSIAGNTGFMWILVETVQLEPVFANLICIGACSLVNFAVCSRFVFALPVASTAFTRHGNARTAFDIGGIAVSRFRMGSKHLCICLCASAIVGPLTPLQAQGLRGETIQAWNEYVLLTENRIEEELYSDDGFLVQEFQAPVEARADREVVLSGQVLVRTMNTTTPGGKDIKVPGGMIHHWRGVVFIPGVTLDGVLAVVQNPDAQDHEQEDVLEARVLTREGDSLRIFLKLVRSKIITVTYNTEHLVRYRRHAARTGFEPHHRDPDRRACRCRHTGRTRETARQGPRIPLAPELLLALPGSGRRRTGRVRVADLEPFDSCTHFPVRASHGRGRGEGVDEPHASIDEGKI